SLAQRRDDQLRLRLNVGSECNRRSLHQDLLRSDRHDHGLRWTLQRHGFRKLDLLRHVERLHLRLVHEEKENQDGEDVHQRHEMQRCGARTLVVALHALGAAGVAHWGASPIEISGKSSARTDLPSRSTVKVRTASITCTTSSYWVSGSTSTVASVFCGNFALTICRYS